MDRKPRSAWAYAGPALTVLCVGLVGWLIAWRAKTIDWHQVGAALEGYHAGTLLLAGALAALSYGFYAGFDLLGRRYTHHAIAPPRVAAIAFVSYAFNLNFGAWIGGIGMRYRLYSQHGLKTGVISRVLGMSLVTNWLGYLCLGGMVFVLRMVPLPPGWRLGADGLQLVGLLMLGVAGAYLGMCWGSRRRSWKVRGTEIHLPPLHLAMLQLCLSLANWLVMATILFVLLHARVPVHTVLAVLLIASIAGVITHIPAGLGVIEAVFVALLTPKIPEARLLAALFAYRGLYYLAPGALAMLVYFSLEHRQRRARLQRPAHSH
jgi:glycosyltransferase 2 family protein